MNQKYYVTPQELKRVVDFLNTNGIGGGVTQTRGAAFAGPFSVPVVEGKDFAYAVLENGEELNAGLVLDMLSKGYTDSYVASTLRASVVKN